jgi:hypothetical protein
MRRMLALTTLRVADFGDFGKRRVWFAVELIA